MRIRLADAVSLACLAVAAAVLALSEYPDRGLGFVPVEETESESEDGDEGRFAELAGVTGILREQYAFQARLDPQRMLQAGLQALTEEFDWVLVSPPFTTDKPLIASDVSPPERVTVQMKGAARSFGLAKIDDLYQATWKLMEVLDTFPAGKRSSPKMEDAVIRGMLTVLDPHTAYLSEEEYDEMKMSTRGAFGGIGIVISVREGELKVMSVMPDTPASRKGVKKGDKIVRIGEESTVNMTVSEAANRLRGEPGTTVDVWLARDEGAAPEKLTMEREVIRVVSVLARDLDGSNAYVRVKGFQQGTADEVEEFLSNTYTEGKPTGVVLDLRGNSGGVMSASVELVDLFLASGRIVTSVEKAGGATETERAKEGSRFENAALVVLVDHGSASASEIVTAALKHNNRALVLGQRTFGKGSVQYVRELLRGALKLTVAQYVGPNMEIIQGAGIEPHIQLGAVRTAGRIRFPSFAQDFEGEGALPYHLEKTAPEAVHESPAFILRYVLDDSESPETVEYDEVLLDFEARMAWDLLARFGSVDAAEMLDKVSETVLLNSDIEDYRLDRVAADEGKTWSRGPVPAERNLQVRAIATPERLGAGEEGTITVTVANSGPQPVPGLYARTESTDSKLDARSCLLGDVEPGESTWCEMPFKSSSTSPHRMDRVFVDVLAGLDEPVASTSFLVETLPSRKPRLSITYRVDDAAGNGDGAVQVGESFDVVMEIRNVGQAPVQEGLAVAENGSGAALFLSSGRVEIGELAAGFEKTARFTFKAQKEPEDGQWNVSLAVIDTKARTRFFANRTLPGTPSKGKMGAVEPQVTLISTSPSDLIGAAASMEIAGEVDFGAGAPVEQSGVAVYNNGNKVAMMYLGDRAPDLTLVPFSFRIALSNGPNRVIVTAFQKNQSQGYATLYYNRLGSPPDETVLVEDRKR